MFQARNCFFVAMSNCYHVEVEILFSLIEASK